MDMSLDGTTQRIGVIWAEAHGHVIGAAGGMPWRLPEDMARFKAITTGSPVVMGRRTWESFPARFRPLPDRDNIVISRDAAFVAEGGTVVGSLEAALAAAAAREPDAESVWVIGGGQVYREVVPFSDVAEVTEIDVEVDGDTTAPELGDGWVTTLLDPASGWHESSTGLRYRYRTLERVPESVPVPADGAIDR